MQESVDTLAKLIRQGYPSALLASVIQADFLFILTGVEKIALNFNRPDMRELGDYNL